MEWLHHQKLCRFSLVCRPGPYAQWVPASTSHETSSILPSFPSLFGYFIFTQSVLGRAGSCKTVFPLAAPVTRLLYLSKQY